mgnify:CR=1 FL=1
MKFKMARAKFTTGEYVNIHECINMLFKFTYHAWGSLTASAIVVKFFGAIFMYVSNSQKGEYAKIFWKCVFGCEGQSGISILNCNQQL